MNAPPFPAAALAAARDDVRAYLRIEGDGEDALIERLAGTALALAESFTRRAWIAREWTDTLAASRVWAPLEAGPVLSIDAVEAVDSEGSARPVPADGYAIDIAADGTGWVRLTGGSGRVRVTYRAGAAEGWTALPGPLAQGVILLAAHLFAQRDDSGAPPAAVGALWRPWRRMQLDAARRRA